MGTHRQHMGGKTLTPQDIDRFWSKVDRQGPDDCWNWTASCLNARGGYGQFGMKRYRTMLRAHRVAFFLTYGHWPAVCRHTCDNPKCCNPNHLLDGTQADNMADKAARGRHRSGVNRGEQNGFAKLTEGSVREIRSAYAVGKHSHSTLAIAFGVSKRAIGRIIRRETWSHVNE